MTYPSVHTGPEIDAAVSVLSDVQDIRDQVAADKATVTTLAGQTATNAATATAAANSASSDAASALASKNDAHTSAQTAGAHAANADSARALAVVARNGAEQAQDSAWEAEGEIRYLLGESEATIDSIRAEILRQKYGSGPYPSLDIGMVGANVLDRRVTFTRASDATYWDSLGTLQTAGPGEPRFDYDPVTGESLGLLVEGQATNLIIRSEDFAHTSWGKSAITISPAATVSPEGLLNASLFLETAETASHYMTRPISWTEGTTYTLSAYAKNYPGTTKRFFALFVTSTVVGEEGPARVVIDLETGESNIVGPAIGYSVTSLPGGWYRVSMTFLSQYSGSSQALQIRMVTSLIGSQSGYEGDGNSGFYLWGAQLETGPTPTSYIKTEASQVTRAADHVWVALEEPADRAGGTLSVHATAPTKSNIFEGVVSVGYNTNNQIGFLGQPTNPGRVLAETKINTTVGFPRPSKDYTPGAPFKAAISWDRDGTYTSFDGGPIAYGGMPSGTPTDELSTLFIGRSAGAAASTSKHIKRVALFRRRLPDEKVIELAA